MILGVAIVVVVTFLAVKDYHSSLRTADSEPDSNSELPSGDQSASLSGSNWQSGGLVTALSGAAATCYGILMKTSVPMPGMFGGTDEVSNISLQQSQRMWFDGGLTLLGIGVFCIAVGAVINALGAKR